jgi:hypothetical protein
VRVLQKGSLGFWGTVGAGIATWIIIAIVGHVAGHWPSVWAGVVAIGLALIHPVRVPAILFALLALAALAGTLAAWRTYHTHRPLSADENAVVKVLAAYDGMKLPMSQIQPLCGFTMLRTEEAVEALIRRGFVSFPRILMGETVYFLVSAGRRYALQKHYDQGLPQPPTYHS